MEVERTPVGDKGPAEWFTGDVTILAIAQGHGSSPVGVSLVRFAAGARTAWHRHSGGQTLFVTEGEGCVQPRGDPIVTIRHGDIVHAPPGEWHWHGAAPNESMSHVSVTEGAEWGEHVTDGEYLGDG
jgi:quercetin dioxygenase-like cupin family protein